jgi:hypothetical protein
MREWKLTPNSPLSLTLAADTHLTALDYVNDQIWELLLGRGEPGSILLQTSYGLRARNMRVFPQFVEEHQTIADPSEFAAPPTLTKFFPNFLRLIFSPFSGIEIQMDYWVPGCQVIAGRIQIKNHSSSDRQLRLELAALLSPIGQGQPMLPEKMEAVTVLHGQTEDLYPILFITGGAEGVSSPYPSLNHNLNLSPGDSRRFTWALASLAEAEESFTVARQTVATKWEAEVAQIEMTNTHQIEITTGDPDWDAAFAFGQKVARTLLYSPSEHLPNTSFVSTRQPDNGFSPQGDGTDYNHLWNGQTALEAWYLSGLLLPGAPETAKGILLNFLEVQGKDSRIDWKPGLAGQRGQMLATPILVSLAWRIYQHTHELDFLERVFRPLLEYILTWFDDRQDRDGDGIPEWDNPIQSGFDNNPSFSRWHSWSQGADITLIESPDLCAILCREIRLLIKMAQELETTEAVSSLEAFADNLHSAVESSWDPRRATYQYWDRETHQSYKGEILNQRQGSGELFLDLVFEFPTRILLRVESEDTLPLHIQASVHGRLPSGQHRVEQIKSDQFQWIEGVSSTTLSTPYADLEHVHIEGIPVNAKASVHIVDLRKEDHTHLVPLWAEIPDASRVEKIIQRKLTKPNQYYRPYGIPACHKPPKHPDARICETVWLPWNVMVAEGLLAYGARTEVVDLITRLMTGIVETLKREHTFRTHYHADLPQSIGEQNGLLGLPPLGLFLETLGVRIHSPWEVHLEGFNPFPWPVKLKFKGLTIECKSQETIVVFPDGQSVTVDDPEPCLVTSASEKPEESN